MLLPSVLRASWLVWERASHEQGRFCYYLEHWQGEHAPSQRPLPMPAVLREFEAVPGALSISGANDRVAYGGY
jgi:hypothetical protein